MDSLLQKQAHHGDCLQGKNVDAARGLAFLINGNITVSGGCPNPALDAETATQVSCAVSQYIICRTGRVLKERVCCKASTHHFAPTALQGVTGSSEPYGHSEFILCAWLAVGRRSCEGNLYCRQRRGRSSPHAAAATQSNKQHDRGCCAGRHHAGCQVMRAARRSVKRKVIISVFERIIFISDFMAIASEA